MTSVGACTEGSSGIQTPHDDDAPDRIQPARRAAGDNPVASAMVERASAFAVGDRRAVASLAATFAGLGCPYQRERTGVLASMIAASCLAVAAGGGDRVRIERGDLQVPGRVGPGSCRRRS
jgi:hypothetical protein